MRVPTLRQQVATLTAEREQLAATVEVLEESVAELTLAMEDQGWTRMLAAAAVEFTRDGLVRITDACRLYTIKNALVRRGYALRAAYVWGQGVQIAARATGKNLDNPREQDVNAVVQAFMDDPGNRRVLFDASAQQRLERALFTDGNVFVALWTKPATGTVSARLLPWDEIQDIICNPQDASEPWYFKRQWTEQAFDPTTGTVNIVSRTAYYPALGYRPKGRQRPKTIAGHPVHWDAPVRHIKVNDQQGWKWGLGDAYPALDWARAYKEFLEAWATLVKALSRYAWRLTAKGSQKAQARARIAQAPSTDPRTGAAHDVGATAILPPDAILEAIPKSGATIDSESGKPLAAMVASSLDVPLTMLLGDPGQTGARAVAETLDQPTELVMQQRRQVWQDALHDILSHVITEAVRAPKGPLKGRIVVDPATGRETVELAGDTSTTVDIDWPDLDDIDPAAVVKAVVEASSTMTVPPEIVLKLLLSALGVKNIDEILDKLTDEQGNFQWPPTPGSGQAGVGQQALDMARAGEDPAQAGVGPAVPGEPAAPSDPVSARQADVDFGLFGSGSQATDGEPTPDAGGAPDTDADTDAGDDDVDVDLTRFQLGG